MPVHFSMPSGYTIGLLPAKRRMADYETPSGERVCESSDLLFGLYASDRFQKGRERSGGGYY